MIELEEKLNAYSHCIGVILAFMGGVFLLEDSNEDLLFGLLIYSLSLLLLFAASTTYHSISKPKLKHKLRIVDHISIYYLIAGTYTPVCLSILSESKGTILLCTVWGIAFFGTILKLFFTGRFEIFSLILYGVMGWLVIIDLPYLLQVTSNKAIFLLGLGGAFYTIGILFYTVRKIPFNHFIWHLFVLAGAISHWFFIYSLVH
jgi:hemolysin III